MKFNLPAIKPRNPLVAASLKRRAGSHRAENASNRQLAKRALRQELHHLDRRQQQSP